MIDDLLRGALIHSVYGYEINVEEIVARGLHEFLDGLQSGLPKVETPSTTPSSPWKPPPRSSTSSDTGVTLVGNPPDRGRLEAF